METVIKIAEKEPSGDVLIFLTGKAVMNDIVFHNRVIVSIDILLGHEEVEIATRLLKDYAENALDSNRKGNIFKYKHIYIEKVIIFIIN